MPRHRSVKHPQKSEPFRKITSVRANPKDSLARSTFNPEAPEFVPFQTRNNTPVSARELFPEVNSSNIDPSSVRRDAAIAVMHNDIGRLHLLISGYTVDDVFNVRRRTNVHDVSDDDPLSIASFVNNFEAMKVLLDFARNRGRLADVVNLADCNGLTPIMRVALSFYERSDECVRCLRLLLEYGADANRIDAQGQGALYHSLRSYTPGGCFDVLFERTDLTRLGSSLVSAGGLFFRAVYERNVEVVRILLCNNFDVEVVGYRNESPLQMAVAQGHLVMMRVLLDAGARVGFELSWMYPEYEQFFYEMIWEYTGRSNVIWQSRQEGERSYRTLRTSQVHPLMNICRAKIRDSLMKSNRFQSMYDTTLDLNALNLSVQLQKYILFK